jgi:hypothetical protein
MRRTASSWRCAVGFGLWVAACGGEEAPPSTVPTNRPDAGDAGYQNGSEPYDGSVPLPRRDAGASTIPPGDPEKGLTGQCAVDSNKIYTVVEREQPFSSTPLAADPNNSRFIMPFVATGDCLDSVHMATLMGAANGGEPVDDTKIDTCAIVRESAATALSDRWLLATTDNREAPYDVWLTPYNPKTGDIAEPQRVTETLPVETTLALTTLSDGKTALLAYGDQQRDVGQALYVRLIDDLGKPVGDALKLDEAPDLYFRNLSIKPLGTGAGLVYVRSSLDNMTSDIVFVALDEQGGRIRDPWVLARNAGPSPSVDITVDGDGGGIVYARAEASIGRQIWFQKIDATGQAALLETGTTRAPAQRIVNSPARGIDVSIAQLRASFVLVYRLLPQTEGGKAIVRAYFLDRNGSIVGSSDVSYTSVGSGRTSVQSTGDGRVVVAWSEFTDEGLSALKVARLPCVGN